MLLDLLNAGLSGIHEAATKAAAEHKNDAPEKKPESDGKAVQEPVKMQWVVMGEQAAEAQFKLDDEERAEHVATGNAAHKQHVGEMDQAALQVAGEVKAATDQHIASQKSPSADRAAHYESRIAQGRTASPSHGASNSKGV